MEQKSWKGTSGVPGTGTNCGTRLLSSSQPARAGREVADSSVHRCSSCWCAPVVRCADSMQQSCDPAQPQHTCIGSSLEAGLPATQCYMQQCRVCSKQQCMHNMLCQINVPDLSNSNLGHRSDAGSPGWKPARQQHAEGMFELLLPASWVMA
jgi:hypothetical protein